MFYKTLLFDPCHAGNLGFVKYLISLDQIDIPHTDISQYFCF